MTTSAPPRRGRAAELPYAAVKPYLLPLLLGALWCFLLLVLMQRGMRNEEKHATDLALLQARTLCAQMLDTRAWNAAHGSVYVRESEYGAPSPWIPEAMRRVTLEDGARLVLVNPAYMSRQIAERSSTKGARLRITSSKPLRPASRADVWEEAALRSINLGQHEVFRLDASEPGPQHFRYMAPLRTEASCLACHANSRLHEVRGGISVTLEAEPFLQTMREYNATVGYTYALTGLAGLLGIGSLSFAINRKRLLAEHKEQMNSAFLANMSHDMRTPLTGIMGIAELLPEEQDTAQQRQSCRYLRSAAAALLDMVTDLTTHAALDAGQLQCVPQPFALRENLENCLELFRPACAEKGLRLTLATAADLPPVLLGDAFRIRQALGNLVGNAAKFTEHGFVSVEARGERLDGDAYMLHLAVQDSGPGIALEEQAHIFERFVRGSRGQARSTPGTGLGLAITRELAGLMHGTLVLESAPGEGSRFTLSLRCALPEDAADALCRPPASESAALRERPPADTPLRIVLAEDNRVSAYFLQESLQRAGHGVAVANNGFDALDLLRESPADLAILDIRMPGMSGLELVERIRAGDAGVDPALPILSITASQNATIRERLRQLGVRVQAEKPLGREQLLQLVDRCIRDARSPIPGEPAGESAPPEAPRASNGASPIPVFDREAALRLVDGSQTLLRKLAAVLLEELPSQEEALAQAMAGNAPAQLRCLAHALKNSAAMLQLRQVQAAGAALENAALTRQDCRPAWRAMQAALPPAREALRVYIDTQARNV